MYDARFRSYRRGAATLAVAVGALFAGTTALLAQAPPSVTLEQAVDQALERHPLIVQAAGGVRTAAAAERSAMGAYLPSLSASAGSSRSGRQQFGTSPDLPPSTVPGASDSYSAGLSAGWDLYTGGRRPAQRVQSRAQSASADANLNEQHFAVVLATKQAFYSALRTQELIGVVTARVQRAEEGVAAAERRMSVGSATKSDVLRAQLELNTAKQSLLEAQNQQRTAAFTLGRQVGEEGPVNAAAGTALEPAPLALSGAELIESLVAASPSVQAAQAAARSADAGVDVAKAQYLPSLRLTTGYNWNNEDPVWRDSRASWSVGLGVSYPLFDGFKRGETTERARVQASVATAQLQDTQRGIRANAERALGNLTLAEQRIVLAREAVQAAEEDLRVQQDRYRLGATTILDLLSSQNALVEAQTSLVTTRFDYQIARAELEALAGRAL